jgi:hypothetical protein
LLLSPRGGGAVKIHQQDCSAMTRNAVYLVTIALGIVIAFSSHQLYRERQTSGVEIHLGGESISIEQR